MRRSAPSGVAKEAWLAQRERGSKNAMRLIAWFTLKFGRPAARLFLYPICLYFALFSPNGRRASKKYLPRVLGRRTTFIDLFKHYHAFASTLHDRVYLLTGRYDYFDLRVAGRDAFENVLRGGRGCILLGAHLGSFEVLRALGTFGQKLPINVFLHSHNAQKMYSILHRMNPDVVPRIIAAGRPDSLLRAKECLDRNEVIGILGDRTFHGEKSVLCEFLGQPAPFPEGPMLLAAILQAPVLLGLGLYCGGKRYDVHFELLAERIALEPAPGNDGSREGRNARRSQQLQPWIARYASRLEHYCRGAPYNWFNFYDFWGQ